MKKHTTLKRKSRLQSKSRYTKRRQPMVQHKHTMKHKSHTKQSTRSARITRKRVGGLSQRQLYELQKNQYRIQQQKLQYQTQQQRLQTQAKHRLQQGLPLSRQQQTSLPVPTQQLVRGQRQSIDPNALRESRKEDARQRKQEEMQEQYQRDLETSRANDKAVHDAQQNGVNEVDEENMVRVSHNYSNVDDVANEFNTFQNNFLTSDIRNINEDQHNLEANQMKSIIDTRLHDLEGDDSVYAQKARERLQVMKKGVNAYSDKQLIDDIKQCPENDQACQNGAITNNNNYQDFGDALEMYKNKVEQSKTNENVFSKTEDSLPDQDRIRDLRLSNMGEDEKHHPIDTTDEGNSSHYNEKKDRIHASLDNLSDSKGTSKGTYYDYFLGKKRNETPVHDTPIAEPIDDNVSVGSHEITVDIEQESTSSPPRRADIEIVREAEVVQGPEPTETNNRPLPVANRISGGKNKTKKSRNNASKKRKNRNKGKRQSRRLRKRKVYTLEHLK